MNEIRRGADKGWAPDQQVRKPQSVPGAEDAAATSAITENADRAGKSELLGEEEDKNNSLFDHARLENGIGGFYAKVLNEPIPEKMLQLIEQLAKQERN